ncbi:MAG: hypothetical protein HFE45_05575 [Oscillospiraceae bacterium]|nr:hypothetical protein [Oscillospiraceae bacterium]
MKKALAGKGPAAPLLLPLPLYALLGQMSRGNLQFCRICLFKLHSMAPLVPIFRIIAEIVQEDIFCQPNN